MTLRVSDHALLRLLERTAAVDVEGLGRSVEAALARAAEAAARVGGTSYTIRGEGRRYIVRDETVVTVLFDRPPG